MNDFNPAQLALLASEFDMEGKVVNVSAFGSGHINDTFRVATDKPGGKQYLLQRVNHHVFKDVAAVMDNIQRVTGHLRARYALEAKGSHRLDSRVLTLIPTTDNEPYYRDEQHNFWRMFILLDGTRSYDIVENPQQALEGGRAFGQFQRMLVDLDVGLIHEVLPDFHHIGNRLAQLGRAVAADTAGRVERVQPELSFIKAREQRMHTILDLAAQGRLPVRITHNDTKFNNVLLDANDRAQCVIDLDTVMPGYVAYDFGDAIRTIINRAAEDEADLDNVQLNIPLFEAYAEGYFEEAHYFLTAAEVASLMEGVLLFPYMQAVRFLTDFLEGDHYYKVQHADHNLQRTCAQLKLVSELEAHETELRAIVSRVAEWYQ
ncbi:phosphotransferase enzyme family protein [Parapedobacter sp. 10938]|uniref:phosphotransferase enzyme family protein n=1 Tax=Parapedobacter flavus TaxID=3110225 RepID=UPI002DBB5BF4|nr:aminoglycoside phosphotransferase family protein [Parapedobacter sp. 10938]MEC3880986.1 aminoglycoside phosphotransferase family protein [Parapedobacter sp. 10938]